MNEIWSQLTPEQKLAERVSVFLAPSDVTFDNERAERKYKERSERIYAAVRVAEPDRVPVTLPIANFPAYYAGKTLHQVMYDYDALREAYLTFMNDFDDDMDTFTGPMLTYSGRMLDILDIKLLNWPGHGLTEAANTYQFVEKENMLAEEYDELIKDPSGFFFRTILPRTVSALASLENFTPLSSMLGRPMMISAPFTSSDIRGSFQRLIDAGEEQEKWLKAVLQFSKESKAAGFPALRGSMATAPFDTLGDSLRGTRGVMTDLFRRPDKIIAAMEVLSDLTIEHTVAAVNASKGFMVTFPLHKGDDAHMSLDKFEEFYWPSLRKVVLGLIEEGIMVTLFAEGRYQSRLAVVNDFPKGWVVWHFDQTDMKEAKKVLGDNCCLMGNVPSSLMVAATPDAVEEYCRELIVDCRIGGGFFLAGGCSTTESKEENLRAMMRAAKKYGTYR